MKRQASAVFGLAATLWVDGCASPPSDSGLDSWHDSGPLQPSTTFFAERLRCPGTVSLPEGDPVSFQAFDEVYLDEGTFHWHEVEELPTIVPGGPVEVPCSEGGYEGDHIWVTFAYL